MGYAKLLHFYQFVPNYTMYNSLSGLLLFLAYAMLAAQIHTHTLSLLSAFHQWLSSTLANSSHTIHGQEPTR